MTPTTFSINYGSRSEERKRLVKAISEYMETFSEYAGAPTFAYTVDNITIDRDGVVSFDDRADSDEIEGLIEYLASKGFNPVGEGDEPRADDPAPKEEPGAETGLDLEAEREGSDPTQEEADPTLVTIELPREGFTIYALANLKKIIESKASLLKKSIGTDDLSFEVTDDIIRFPWFHTEDAMELAAYTRLVSAMGRMAKEAKRVTGTDHPVESEKYAFRIWLLRLGFSGSEFKNDRAILMRNLSGHTAFKNQAAADAFYQKLRNKKADLRAETEAVEMAAAKMAESASGVDGGEEAQEA